MSSCPSDRADVEAPTDQHSRPLGLVLDVDGHVVAWENNAEGNPDLSDDWRGQRVPPEVEQAAGEWWSEQGAA